MNEQSLFGNGPTEPTSTPSDGEPRRGDGSSDSSPNVILPPAQEPPPGVSAANDDERVAHADDKKQGSKDTWPPPGAVIFTTDETRLYLYKHHDIFLKERYTQRLVTDKGVLVGRRIPKDGGGVELQITQASVDQYAEDNPQKKNAKDTPLDPEDKLFDEFRKLAAQKDYVVPIEGDVTVRTTPTTPDKIPQEPTPPPVSPTNQVNTPPASAPPADDQIPPSANVNQVPETWYNEMKTREQQANDRYRGMQDINVKLYETLDSTYTQLADTQAALTSIARIVAENAESPSEIIKSMAELLREAGNSRALGATTFVTERENQND